MTNYATIPLGQLREEIARLKQVCDEATAKRIQTRAEAGFWSLTGDGDVRDALQAEKNACNNYERAKAALAAREHGRKPDPSTKEYSDEDSKIFTTGTYCEDLPNLLYSLGKVPRSCEGYPGKPKPVAFPALPKLDWRIFAGLGGVVLVGVVVVAKTRK